MYGKMQRIPNIEPVIMTPLSDLASETRSCQDGPCRDFENNLVDCILAYGFYRARKECQAVYYDFLECLQSPKQLHRSELIHATFEHQVKKGERKYLEAPPIFFY